ncbi:hypothetical protein KJ359_006892 [Pestalotiopsis sp. 9143b]|nr:hypothetical protein KJ359_006892 [Pestalotiopsis sp. 9143b]
MRCIPISATQTKMEYEVYRGNEAPDEHFTWISEFFKQVLREDKDLCNAAQKNLEIGIFTNGVLHPQAEKGYGKGTLARVSATEDNDRE